ncbi:MAG TPA: hypothetical protein VNO30_39340 [Kofleriaceae bacterium]|nr:hypothetical protein [Kofleriaceae bacterium]
MLIRPSVLAVPLLAVAAVAAAASPARADDGEPDESDAADEIARSAIRTIRRSIALGPTLGGFSAYAPSAGEFEGGLSFGLELELFRNKLPTPQRIRDIARQKAQEKLAAIIRDRFAGQAPDPATRRQLVREIAAEVKAEVLASLAGRPRLIERPRLAIQLEANYLFSSADWLARFGAAFGVGPLSLGPTFSARFGDDTVARLGAELSLHLLPTKSARSPVIDVFLRGDFELHARGTNDDQIGLGLRVLLDLI